MSKAQNEATFFGPIQADGTGAQRPGHSVQDHKLGGILELHRTLSLGEGVVRCLNGPLRNQQVSGSSRLVGSSSNPEKSGFFVAVRDHSEASLQRSRVASLTRLPCESAASAGDVHS